MSELLLALRLLMAFLLYGFLGVAFYILWRNLQEEASQVAAPPPVAHLIIEGEGEEKDSPLQVRPVTGIGRTPDNDLCLEDPFASGHHALILWREEQWWVEDLESHNGTYLNGEPISGVAPLASGDRIRIGETWLRFEIAAD